MRDEDEPEILVALEMHWMKPFSQMDEKYLAWCEFVEWMKELMLESRQMKEFSYLEDSSNIRWPKW